MEIHRGAKVYVRREKVNILLEQGPEFVHLFRTYVDVLGLSGLENTLQRSEKMEEFTEMAKAFDNGNGRKKIAVRMVYRSAKRYDAMLKEKNLLPSNEDVLLDTLYDLMLTKLLKNNPAANRVVVSQN